MRQAFCAAAGVPLEVQRWQKSAGIAKGQVGAAGPVRMPEVQPAWLPVTIWRGRGKILMKQASEVSWSNCAQAQASVRFPMWSRAIGRPWWYGNEMLSRDADLVNPSI